MTEEQERFEQEIDLFVEMFSDFSLHQEDYYKAFKEMCDRYDNRSLIPYSVYCFLLDEECPAEEYYLQMLIELYDRRDVGFHEREDEVICLPIKLGGKMEVIKVESML